MRIVVFGLTISSSWGNGHATLLRGLFRALHGLGHEVHFFERDTPYYARWRDAESLPYAHLHLYADWDSIAGCARETLAAADVGMVTSYCPDGIAASEMLIEARVPRTIFYDMDTPVTLERLERGESVPYIPESGLRNFDLALSYTGGEALDQLRQRLGARCAATLYGWVDPAIHHRVEASHWFDADLSYLGTYSQDRQAALEELLLTPARRLANRRFLIGGAMYPNPEAWPKNIRYYHHVAPPEHCAFYSSSPLTLNITRASMAAMGYCPSGRLFEAAAIGAATLSDWWEGLDTFFAPGEEILIATSTADAMAAICRDRAELERIGARAQQRTFDCHTADLRAKRLIELIDDPRDEAGRPAAAAACTPNES